MPVSRCAASGSRGGHVRETGKLLMLPNLLSISRIVAAPLMIVAALAGQEQVFIGLYLLSLITDGTDGFIARHLHHETSTGAMLDSIGDFAICTCLPLSAYHLWPEMITGEIPFILVGLACYLIPVILGVLRYGRMPSFHTWGAKTIAVLASLALAWMFITGQTWAFRLCIPLVVLEAIQELVMIALLPDWSPDTRSLWHALRKRRARLPRVFDHDRDKDRDDDENQRRSEQRY